MGWFSPVKGSYPSLAQVDKTLPIGGNFAVERGMIVALGADSDGKPVWNMPAGTAADKILYVALTDSTDPTAGFAGTAFDPKGGGTPAITAIDLAQDGEYETSVFDLSKTYQIGDEIMAGADGKITKGSGTTIGYVTAVPTSRWINNAVAFPKDADRRLAARTGAREKVLRFKTAL